MIGFATTATQPISRSYVHYDCGCVLSETGELVQRHGTNEFSIPSVYIAFFATFGAMVSLLNDNILFLNVESFFLLII
jgi:hypothetical protein